jgi:hypothetical protein
LARHRAVVVLPTPTGARKEQKEIYMIIMIEKNAEVMLIQYIKKNNHYCEIKWKDKDYSSTLKYIKVILFHDKLEIEKFNTIIPFSSMDNLRKGASIRRIIDEISVTTGISEDDILIIKDT